MKLHAVEYVIWRDASGNHGWVCSSELDSAQGLMPMVLHSVGLLVRETKMGVYLAQDWDAENEGIPERYRNLICIPHEYIVRRFKMRAA